MSHFTVLVIGDDVGKQLAPFHEFECTGTDDEYVQEIDETTDVLARTKPVEEGGEGETLEEALEYFDFSDERGNIVHSMSAINRAGPHQYRYAHVTDDGKLIHAVKRTNPNAHWDWWKIGGRWAGCFKLKLGHMGKLGEHSLGIPRPASDRADQCFKKGVDMEAMRTENRARAASQYDAWEQATAGLPQAKTWAAICEEVKALAEVDPSAIGIESWHVVARVQYQSQARVKACSRDEALRWCRDAIAEFSPTREQYIQAAEDETAVPHAIVHEGKWLESGEMGWWGVVHNEKDPAEWNRVFRALWESLPDDTMVTLVDCHI